MATINVITWDNPKTGKPGKAYQVRYFDQHGKRRSKNFKRQKDAELFRRQVEREVDDGVHVVERESATVEEAAKIWLEAVEVGRNGRPPAEASTLRGYRNRADNHIVPLIGHLKLSRLTTPRVIEFRDELLKTGRSRQMTKLILTALKGIIGEAQSRGLVVANVASPVSIVTTGRHKKRVTIPTKDEIRTIVAAAEAWVEEMPDHFRQARPRDPDARVAYDATTRNRMRWFSLLVKTTVLTGMRASEVLGMAWPNVDLRAGVISVEQRLGDGGKLGPVKSEAGRRRISIPDSLRRALAEWKLACPKGPLELVFPNMSGKPESLTNIYKRFWFPLQRSAKVVEDVVEGDIGDEPEAEGPATDTAATVGADGKKTKPKYGLHALRHFRASILIEAGADPKDVQAELGHSSIQMTFDVYGHLFPDHVERSKKRSQEIADALFGK